MKKALINNNKVIQISDEFEVADDFFWAKLAGGVSVGDTVGDAYPSKYKIDNNKLIVTKATKTQPQAEIDKNITDKLNDFSNQLKTETEKEVKKHKF
ncbi:MAG: hypothetical protein Rpha_1141 [Candidatus Ruthia sp. Apha_13_S6]|nr:hypothetical protein [Candidatus Ruthia sp. Apha_13_S6]